MIFTTSPNSHSRIYRVRLCVFYVFATRLLIHAHFFISVTPDGHQMLIGDTGKALGHRDFRVYYAQRVPPSSMQVATVSGAARERAAHLRAIYTKMIGDGRMRQLAPETAAARAARKHHHSEQRKKDLRTAQTNELMMGKHFRRRDIHW